MSRQQNGFVVLVGQQVAGVVMSGNEQIMGDMERVGRLAMEVAAIDLVGAAEARCGRAIPMPSLPQ